MSKLLALWIAMLTLVGASQGQDASIGGRITSVDGRVLPDAEVSLLRARYTEQGQRFLDTVESVRSDARGEYRFRPSILPGRFYISAGSTFAPGPSYLRDQIEKEGLSLASPPKNAMVYYKSSPDVATAIDVRAGVEITGIDLTVPQVGTFQIRGRVIEDETGAPPPSGSRITFLLWPREDIPVSLSAVYAAEMRMSRRPYSGDGTFLHADVPAGEYWVIARIRKGIGTDAPLPATTSFARTLVRIVDSDITGVQLKLPRLVPVNAQLRVDDNAPMDLPGIRVWLSPLRNSWGHMMGAEVWPPTPTKPDGTFQFEHVALGEYQLFVSDLPPNAYVRDARFGSNDVLAKPVNVVGPSSDSIVVTISGKAGRIEGSVTDKTGARVRAARVVLVPDRQRDRTDLYITEASNSEGNFVLGNIPPGDYKAFAWRTLERHAYFDPDLLARHESTATSIKVAESSRQSLTIEVADTATGTTP
jgi:hypothetical protein